MNFPKDKIFNKKWLIFLSLAAIFILIFPKPALALDLSSIVSGIFNIAGGLALKPFFVLFGITLGCFIMITQGLAIVMGFVLDFVISPAFISYSYTNPANNPVIAAGLKITQSFVNMGLVIVLVYLAISITLRLNETEAKKALARLILVALLVNFAPVVCGLIVDASNIFMNYFIVGIEKGISGILSQIVEFGEGFAKGLLSITATFQVSILTHGAIQIILNLSVFLAFLLFAVLFIVRYVALWTIVILSPLAFVAWVMPDTEKMGDRWWMIILFPLAFLIPLTKKMWDMWWNQLIQWSVIGIPAAFFLYLGMRVFEALKDIYTGKLDWTLGGNLTASFGDDWGWFDRIFPYFVVLAFLYIGFLVALQTSAWGTKAIMRGFKAATKTAAVSGLLLGLRTAGGIAGATGVSAITGLPGRFKRGYNEGGGGWGGLREGFRQLGHGIAPPRGTAYRLWRRRATVALSPRRMGRGLAGGAKSVAGGLGDAIRNTATAGWKAATKEKKRKLTPEERETGEVEEPEEGREERRPGRPRGPGAPGAPGGREPLPGEERPSGQAGYG